MANIFDVANYILHVIGPVSTLKLQKLTYYCQAWSLAWTGKPLFREDFEAWANGPVNRKLFKQFQGEFIATKIPSSKCSSTLTRSDIQKIDVVLDTYGPLSGADLSDLTHSEAPWKNARAGLPPSCSSSNIISKDSMRKFYSSFLK